LHMIGPELSLIAAKLAGYIRDQELVQWFSVPSILTYMAKFDVVKSDDFPKMTRLMWCGEVLPTPTLIYFMKRLPHVQFTNLYGPTEATIASSYYTMPGCPADEREDVPIGVGCAGEELLVLDEELKPTPHGEIGHLYIRGVGLSPGYWKDEEKTAAAFKPNPALEGDRIYRTGDLARMHEDANVRFLGREDSQIKSRGYRIELGEIETALSALEYLKESAVVGVATGGFEGTAICCGYAPAKGAVPTPPEIRDDLIASLPKYMLPARWKEFDKLPKNANGKIDRRKIREIFEAESSSS
ncbi:MAG: AMP-binding protein, partial [Planctomycetota bacterium]|nr:AMP-binding protein [Planctomycetota bacterium]